MATIKSDTAPAAPAEKLAAALSKEEVLRYSRHLIMPEVGLDGQLKLKRAKVLMIGTGELAPYLVQAHVAVRSVVRALIGSDSTSDALINPAPRLWPATDTIPFHYPHPVTGQPIKIDNSRAREGFKDG